MKEGFDQPRSRLYIDFTFVRSFVQQELHRIVDGMLDNDVDVGRLVVMLPVSVGAIPI